MRPSVCAIRPLVQATACVLSLTTAPVGCLCPPGSPNILSIERNFDNDFEEALIVAAESHCPDRQDVILVADEDVLDSLPDESECLWWYTHIDHTRWPYAITADFIDYYSQLAGPDNVDGSMNPSPEIPRGPHRFEYSASVDFAETIVFDELTFTDVHVVTLDAFLAISCGSTNFEKDRSVVFAEDGTLLAVFGDGETSLTIGD